MYVSSHLRAEEPLAPLPKGLLCAKRTTEGASPSPEGLLEFISRRGAELKADGRTSSARSYVSLANSLSAFVGVRSGAGSSSTANAVSNVGSSSPAEDCRTVSFGEVDREFVAAYSEWLAESGVTDSTQSFYLRTLRSVMRHAASEGLCRLDGELFRGMNTRVIFRKEVAPEVPDRETIRRMEAMDLSELPDEELVRDMFLFGFHCRGMELVDLMNLRRDALQGETLCFRRRSKGLTRTVRLDAKALEIAEKYRNSGGEFLFPLHDRTAGMQPSSVHNAVGRAIKAIGKTAGFPTLTFGMNIGAWKRLSNVEF